MMKYTPLAKKNADQIIDILNKYINYIESLEVNLEYMKSQDYYKDMEEKMQILREQCNLGFPITQEETDKIEQWKQKHTRNVHLTTNFSYKFYPTCLGTVGECICEKCGEKFLFRDIT